MRDIINQLQMDRKFRGIISPKISRIKSAQNRISNGFELIISAYLILRFFSGVLYVKALLCINSADYAVGKRERQKLF